MLTDRFIALDAELSMYAPGLISPTRMLSPKIEQFRPLEPGPNGGFVLGLQQIRADHTMTTGSRFPKPGYRFNSRSVDVTRVQSTTKNPIKMNVVSDEDAANGNTKTVVDDEPDLTWLIDARQNVFWMGRIPVFYWPRFVQEADDLQPYLRQFGFSTNNYFGQQFLTDWNVFRLLNIRKPKPIDIWSIDIDYLSARTKTFPALGTESAGAATTSSTISTTRTGEIKKPDPSWRKDYFGYLRHLGPARLRQRRPRHAARRSSPTTSPPARRAISAARPSVVPAFQDYRGRFTLRHMQRFLPNDDEHTYEDFRAPARSRVPIPTVTSSKNTTSDSSTPAWTRKPWLT